MDGPRFDDLIKQLGTTRLTRLTVLRGLAASAAALAGMSLVADDVDAADGKRRRRRRVCDCASADPNTCTNRRLKARAAKRLLRRNDCAYKGRCTGVSGCAVGCTQTNNIPNTRGSCPVGQMCSADFICVPGPAECGGACVPGQEVCCPPGSKKAGICVGNFNACQL